MSSLSEHLYNKAHGRIYKKSMSVTDTSFPGDVIASPSSGNRLCITHITFAPSAAAVATTVKSYEGDGTTVADTLFTNVIISGFLLGIPTVDMLECPIILEVDQQLQATVSAGNCYITVRGFEL